ncbi:MAG: hypothetical protein LM558_03235 [Thermosphaera sp.]|nr:hypothetical protein [Thermosphaera sp.]
MSVVSLVSPTARLVLLAILVASGCSGSHVTMMESYATYVRLAQVAGFKPVTVRQYRNILDVLEELGAVERLVWSVGYYGKISIVAVRDPERILSELREDLALGGLAEEVCSSLPRGLQL